MVDIPEIGWSTVANSVLVISAIGIFPQFPDVWPSGYLNQFFEFFGFVVVDLCKFGVFF
jgi:hypothetical protein